MEIELNNTIYYEYKLCYLYELQCMCVGPEFETQAGHGEVKRQFHLMAATLTAATEVGVHRAHYM